MNIAKRNGTIEKFEPNKIVEAIKRAWNEKDGPISGRKAFYIADFIEHKAPTTDITVEDAQQLAIDAMIEFDLKYTLADFVTYKTKHDVNRSMVNTIEEVMQQSNPDIVKDNANIDGKSNVGIREAMSNNVIKNFNLNYLLPKYLAKAHSKDIYIHDLGYSFFAPFTNCSLLNAEYLLKNGFRMGSAIIEPPKSLRTAATVLTQCMANASAGQYGGLSVHDVDLLLEPYVNLSYQKYLEQSDELFGGDSNKSEQYAEYMTEKEVKDSMQTVEYQLNSLINGHAQSIFCTLGFGMGTSWACRLIQKYILKTRIQGLGKNHETAIFPKLAYFVKDGINKNPNDPNYDIKQLALECTAKRMYPDWINVDKLVEITGGRKTPMGCRSFLGEYNGQYSGRFNLGVVTINLPRISLEVTGDTIEERINSFFSILTKKAELAHDALKLRIKYLSKAKASCNPFLWQEGAFATLKPDEYIIDRAKNGYASISLGYIGIHEAINGIYQEDGQIIGNSKKTELAQLILKELSNYCDKWKHEEGFAYSLYGTPAESLCSTFLQADKKDYGVVKGVTDKEYYQNSFHLDVREKVDPYTKIDFEANFQPYSKGGFISYVELPSMVHNIKALEDIIDYSYDKLGYFGINTPADVCDECHFIGEAEWDGKRYICPSCGNKNVVAVRRVCGYLGNPGSRDFNEGKQSEVLHRVNHL